MLYQLSYLGAPAQCSGSATGCRRQGGLTGPNYNRAMGRVIHVRLHGLDPADRDSLQQRFTDLATSRDWRDEPPWLADSLSRDLFPQLYFDGARVQADREATGLPALSAATFVRIVGDETDALALMFMLRELSEKFGVICVIRDPDNPIAKLRSIDLRSGRLSDGRQLEEILVRRPIFKKLRDGQRIEMYPPRALGSAFGTLEGEDKQRRDWGFLVFGMRDQRPTFLEAEAEAMRIYRGLRQIE